MGKNPPDASGKGTVPVVVLRAATRADSAAVRELVFRVLREHGLEPDAGGADADLEDLEAAYAARGDWFGVLLDRAGHGRVIGSVGLSLLEPGVVELRKMYLDPAWRGLGLGRSLLERALAEARGRRVQRVRLETATVLGDAIRLYEKAGFRPLPCAPHVGRCDRVMELELEPGPVSAGSGACLGGLAGASSPACDPGSSRGWVSSSCPP